MIRFMTSRLLTCVILTATVDAELDVISSGVAKLQTCMHSLYTVQGYECVFA